MLVVRNCTNPCLCNIIGDTVNCSILSRVANKTLYYEIELYIFSNYFSALKVYNSYSFRFNKPF